MISLFTTPKPIPPKPNMDLKQCEYCLKADFTYIFKSDGRCIVKICLHCQREYKTFNVTVLPTITQEKWKTEVEEITQDPKKL